MSHKSNYWLFLYVLLLLILWHVPIMSSFMVLTEDSIGEWVYVYIYQDLILLLVYLANLILPVSILLFNKVSRLLCWILVFLSFAELLLMIMVLIVPSIDAAVEPGVYIIMFLFPVAVLNLYVKNQKS